MNNINRRQQIPVAFNAEKAMTYGSALQATASRNVALSNLNRMSNATNPWVRKVAQGALSNNWVDYQNELVEQASGTAPQQEYYREALGQIRNPQNPNSMNQRLSQVKSEIKSEMKEEFKQEFKQDPFGQQEYGLGAEFFEQRYGGSENEDIQSEGGGYGGAPFEGGGGMAGGGMGGYLQEPEQEFDLATLLEQGRQGRKMREARYQTVAGGSMPGGWRSEVGLEPGTDIGEASSILMGRLQEASRLQEDPSVLSADLPREFGGSEALGGFTQGGGGLISREMFEEAERQQSFARQESLRGENPLAFISLFTQDVKSEVENLGQYEREALEQGVEQDFSTPDITLRRRRNRFADLRSQQQQTLGNPVSSVFQYDELVRGLSSNQAGRGYGLPDFEFQASGAGEAGGYASRENFGGGSMPSIEQLLRSNPAPEGTSEDTEIAYSEWLGRTLRGFGRLPADPFRQYMNEQSRSMY